MDLIKRLVFSKNSNKYSCRWCDVISVVIICWSNFGCLQGMPWEVTIKDGEGQASFHVESDQIKIEKKEAVYLIYSDQPGACSYVQGPPKSSLRVNSVLILVAEYYNGCDLISKVKNAKDFGYDGMILIRDGLSSDVQETYIRNTKLDFNVFFADEDEGVSIRDFAIKNSNDPFRHKVILRPIEISGNWFDFDFDTTDATQNLKRLCTRIEDCRVFLIKNLDIMVGSGILLTVTCFIVYSMIIAIWHEICWIFRSPNAIISTTPVRVPVTPVDIPFVSLPEVTWQESVDDLPSICTICFDDFCPNDQLLRLPCRHLDFHKQCIHEWFKDPEHRSCPICREPIPDSSLDPKEFPRRPLPYAYENQAFMSDINNDLFNLILDQIMSTQQIR